MIRSQPVLVAMSINWDGRPCVLVVGMAHRENQKSWREFVPGLRQRGLGGPLVVGDDDTRLKKAIREMLPEAAWQRCYVHFLHNTLDYLPRKADDQLRCLLPQFRPWVGARGASPRGSILRPGGDELSGSSSRDATPDNSLAN